MKSITQSINEWKTNAIKELYKKKPSEQEIRACTEEILANLDLANVSAYAGTQSKLTLYYTVHANIVFSKAYGGDVEQEVIKLFNDLNMQLSITRKRDINSDGRSAYITCDIYNDKA